MHRNWCICPRANIGYIPVELTGWPFWCPRENVCSQLKFWLKFYTRLRKHFSWTVVQSVATVSFLLACMWFSPFKINTPLFFIFFHKMAAGSHFRWAKIILDCISHHFRSIHKFFFDFFFTKCQPAAILDDRKSLSITFLAISDQYDFFLIS